MQDAGIRAFIGKLSMDISSRPTYVEASAAGSLKAAREFINALRSEYEQLPDYEVLVEPIITPRFIPTCSDELLHGLGHLAAQENVRIQSHMSESHDQVEWVKALRNEDDITIFSRVTAFSFYTWAITFSLQRRATY
jgi:guanine deaminase